MIDSREEIKIEKNGESFVRIIFNPNQHHVTPEIGECPDFFDTIIPHHAAEINFSLRYAGIIDISYNSFIIDSETVDKLVESIIKAID